MKLTDKYEASSYAIPNNPLFPLVEPLFNRLLAGAPAIDPSRLDYASARFDYQQTPIEREFYETSYLLLSRPMPLQEVPFLSAHFLLTDRAPIRVGITEIELLQFLQEPVRHVVFHGGMGNGKTTTLRYTFFNILPQSPTLSSSYFPIYLSLDTYYSSATQRQNEDLFISFFENSVLAPHAEKATVEITDPANSDFYDYLKRHPGFIALDLEERTIIRECGMRQDELHARINCARLNARKRAECHFIALRYMADIQLRQPVIVIDDADQLGIRPCAFLLKEVCTLGDRYHCKLYLSLRTTTFNTAQSVVLVGSL